MPGRNIIDDEFISMLEGHDLCMPKTMNGMFGGSRKSDKYGSSPEFADYRDYQPGDDLRRIDWNLFARFDRLYLRLFVDERQPHHRIYIDTSKSMDFGEPTKGYTACRLAAALAYLGVSATDRVSLYTLREKNAEPIHGSFTGRDAFYEAADRLNRLSWKGECDLKSGLTAAERNAKNDGITVIISDFLTESDWKSAVDPVVERGRQVVLIQVLSREELTPKLFGKLTLLDSEAESEEDVRNMKTEISRRRMRAYEEAFRFLQNDIKEFCESRKVGFFTVISDESIERILFDKGTGAGVII